MRFNDNARLDTTQVEDVRGQGGGFGGGGAPGRGGLGSPIVVGGGGGGLLLVVLFVAFQLLGGGLSTQTSTAPTTAVQPGSEVAGNTVSQSCRTGADANARTDCRIVGVVNSVQSYWSGEMPRRGIRYTESDTVFYSGTTQAGCGVAQSATGPFYCPNDQKVYLDLSFFDELKSRFGAQGGPFAQAYVVAHEYGHHVQDLMGALQQSRTNAQGAQGGSVRIELQADCLAGVWANHAVQTGYIENLTDADIADGLDAAAAVGDDRLQKQAQGRVTPEAWTHGSSEQRQHWFRTGYQSGDMGACNTSQGTV
jgi:uncharacterized protein